MDVVHAWRVGSRCLALALRGGVRPEQQPAAVSGPAATRMALVMKCEVLASVATAIARRHHAAPPGRRDPGPGSDPRRRMVDPIATRASRPELLHEEAVRGAAIIIQLLDPAIMCQACARPSRARPRADLVLREPGRAQLSNTVSSSPTYSSRPLPHGLSPAVSASIIPPPAARGAETGDTADADHGDASEFADAAGKGKTWSLPVCPRRSSSVPWHHGAPLDYKAKGSQGSVPRRRAVVEGLSSASARPQWRCRVTRAERAAGKETVTLRGACRRSVALRTHAERGRPRSARRQRGRRSCSARKQGRSNLRTRRHTMTIREMRADRASQ